MSISPFVLVTLGGWRLLGGRSAPVRNQLVICPPESLWRFGGRLKGLPLVVEKRLRGVVSKGE